MFYSFIMPFFVKSSLKNKHIVHVNLEFVTICSYYCLKILLDIPTTVSKHYSWAGKF